MKSEEFLDEGWRDWTIAPLARSALLGRGQYFKQKALDERNDFVKDFVTRLELAWKTALETKELGESIDFSNHEYKTINRIFESILNEATKTASQWLVDEILPKISSYRITAHDKSILDQLATEFEQKFNANKTVFPKDIANKIAGWVYNLGTRQERDEHSRIQRSSASVAGAPVQGAGSLEGPTLAAWNKITRSNLPGWPNLQPGAPLRFDDFSGMRDFQFDFSNNVWMDVTDPSSPMQVSDPASIKKLNGEYMRRTNLQTAPTSSQAQSQSQTQPQSQAQQSTSSIAAQSSEDDQTELQQMRAQVDAENKKTRIPTR